jgi:hypothetical protein
MAIADDGATRWCFAVHKLHLTTVGRPVLRWPPDYRGSFYGHSSIHFVTAARV